MAKDRWDKKFDRCFVAVVTPYQDNYEVDEAALRKYLQYFMQPKFRNTGGIIINPEAGELFYLTRQEKRRNVEIAMEECGGKLPVFAGVVELQTREAVKVAIDAKEAGVDGIFLIPPMGAMDVCGTWDAEKYPEVWIDMAKAEVEAVDLPAITHPAAPPSGGFARGLPLGATLRMCQEIPNIVGWKMLYTYPNFRTIAKSLRSLDRHVAIMAASANFYHEYLANDYFDGTVSGAFCYAMEPMIDHISAWKNGDIKEAFRIWNSGLLTLHDYVYSELSRLHVRYKAAAWLRGLIPLPIMRPPFPKPKREEVLKLRELLDGAGLTVISEGDMNTVLSRILK